MIYHSPVQHQAPAPLCGHLPACTGTCLPARAPAHMHGHLPSCIGHLPSCMGTCLPVRAPACLHMHLLAFMPTFARLHRHLAPATRLHTGTIPSPYPTHTLQIQNILPIIIMLYIYISYSPCERATEQVQGAGRDTLTSGPQCQVLSLGYIFLKIR